MQSAHRRHQVLFEQTEHDRQDVPPIGEGFRHARQLLSGWVECSRVSRPSRCCERLFWGERENFLSLKNWKAEFSTIVKKLGKTCALSATSRDEKDEFPFESRKNRYEFPEFSLGGLPRWKLIFTHKIFTRKNENARKANDVDSACDRSRQIRFHFSFSSRVSFCCFSHSFYVQASNCVSFYFIWVHWYFWGSSVIVNAEYRSNYHHIATFIHIFCERVLRAIPDVANAALVRLVKLFDHIDEHNDTISVIIFQLDLRQNFTAQLFSQFARLMSCEWKSVESCHFRLDDASRDELNLVGVEWVLWLELIGRMELQFWTKYCWFAWASDGNWLEILWNVLRVDWWAAEADRLIWRLWGSCWGEGPQGWALGCDAIHFSDSKYLRKIWCVKTAIFPSTSRLRSLRVFFFNFLNLSSYSPSSRK